MLDTANRLSGVPKPRDLDYINKKCISWNQPGVESLRKFVVHELNMIISDHAHSFINLTIRIEQVGLATVIWLIASDKSL